MDSFKLIHRLIGTMISPASPLLVITTASPSASDITLGARVSASCGGRPVWGA